VTASKPIDRALLHRFTAAWIDSYSEGVLEL
jgi:hypothetical protein